jgi:two-component sensor histidine kinase
VIAALELDRRLHHAGQAISYLAVSLPIAVLAIPAVLLLLLGAALSVVGIGMPIVLVASVLCRRLVRLDRRLANRFLDAHIPPLPWQSREEGTAWHQAMHVLADRMLWRVVAQLTIKPPLMIGLIVVAGLPVLLLAGVVQLAVEGLGGGGGLDYVGPWEVGPGLGAAMLVFALPSAVLALATLDSLKTLLCTITRGVLAPRTSASGPVRQILAESLGDRSASIAYWLPHHRRFVDETGRPVVLPEPGSGRAWTAVERDGRRVAAIIHDASLDTSTELVSAAAAASSLAIDNERLKADLRARLEELRVSRLRIVEAADAARRRIERDLHDGAQQQLVALALDLRMLRARLKDQPEAAAVVDQISERLSSALAELREFARGIHPAILTDRGLAPAVGALADRASVPIDVEIAIEERLPAPVEAAAYFVVAEALTNVDRYAGASGARVDVRREGHTVVVVVADDGSGGVDTNAGSGLRGLQDRLAALGGTLAIDSPPGRGTRIEARIPGSPEPQPAGSPEEALA